MIIDNPSNMVNHTNNHRRTGQCRRNRKVPIPNFRSRSSETLMYVVSLIFLIVSVVSAEIDTNSADTVFIIISILIPALFLVELICRLLHVIEEHRHLVTRYDSSYVTLIRDVFYFTPVVSILTVASSFLIVINYIRFGQSPSILWYSMGCKSVLFSLASAVLVERNMHLRCGPLYDSLWIENSNGLNFGSGMAHSFFHGYLELVIPKTGTVEKHLEELMKDYEDKHRVKLEFYKLFVLIPKSLHCPTSLKDDEISPSIEESSSLDPKIITRAGVQNRVYKNSIYKIKSDRGRKVYVCAEYATPLKTLKDIVKYNGEHSNHYKKHKNDIVLQFYQTLQKILKEHDDCTNYCELIFYDDKDQNGRYRDVGQILLKRIRKLQKWSS